MAKPSSDDPARKLADEFYQCFKDEGFEEPSLPQPAFMSDLLAYELDNPKRRVTIMIDRDASGVKVDVPGNMYNIPAPFVEGMKAFWKFYTTNSPETVFKTLALIEMLPGLWRVDKTGLCTEISTNLKVLALANVPYEITSPEGKKTRVATANAVQNNLNALYVLYSRSDNKDKKP